MSCSEVNYYKFILEEIKRKRSIYIYINPPTSYSSFSSFKNQIQIINKGKEELGLNPDIIIGIAFGVCGLFVILSVLINCFCKKKNNGEKIQINGIFQEPVYQPPNPIYPPYSSNYSFP